ncbi:uncharacterized protein LOC115765994 [Drosophila novamexicana]|uniref:uncharacterized protein LOC115765994 n=1 Tax=Drosophila novamexicana TaxID=47314 RepID=UPI0011E5B8AA|nr:uncharacterized protein LOC115765994 [Drosophila novamexicana]
MAINRVIDRSIVGFNEMCLQIALENLSLQLKMLHKSTAQTTANMSSIMCIGSLSSSDPITQFGKRTEWILRSLSRILLPSPFLPVFKEERRDRQCSCCTAAVQIQKDFQSDPDYHMFNANR